MNIHSSMRLDANNELYITLQLQESNAQEEVRIGKISDPGSNTISQVSGKILHLREKSSN